MRRPSKSVSLKRPHSVLDQVETTLDTLLRTGEAPLMHLLQEGKYMPDDRSTGPFTEEGKQVCLHLGGEIGAKYVASLLDHNIYTEQLKKIHPSLLPRVRMDKTEAGLVQIRYEDFVGGHGAQWYGLDANAFYINRTLPGASNGVLQLSDILCNALDLSKMRLFVRPDCYKISPLSSALSHVEAAAWIGAGVPRTFEDMDKMDKEISEIYAEDEICREWRLCVLVKPQGDDVEIIMEELPVVQENGQCRETYSVNGREYVACRFLHAWYRRSKGIYHLDGAIEIYEGNAYNKVWSTKKLSDRNKPLVKRKIFRLDSDGYDISYEMFTHLAATFYKWNWHIVDHFWPGSLEPERNIRRRKAVGLEVD